MANTTMRCGWILLLAFAALLMLFAGTLAVRADSVIEGTVVAVQGDDVVIHLSAMGSPSQGDRVELVYVTSSGMALPVGTWRVRSVDGATVKATHVESSATARKGLKARIHHQRKTPVKAETPKPAASSNSGKDAKPPEKEKPLTFLGENAVNSVADTFERAQDYYFGRNGKTRNYDKAAGLFRQCAEKGHAHSQNFLGTCYRFGNGVPKDDKKAAFWFGKASDQGLDSGQYNLGVMYANGAGVAKNLSEAVRLFRLSADQGYARAQHNMAVMYRNGMGMAKDDRMAAAWMHKAAEQNLAPSQYELGNMYEKGIGVSKNYGQALVWYRKAAKAGDRKARKTLESKGLRW